MHFVGGDTAQSTALTYRKFPGRHPPFIFSNFPILTSNYKPNFRPSSQMEHFGYPQLIRADPGSKVEQILRFSYLFLNVFSVVFPFLSPSSVKKTHWNMNTKFMHIPSSITLRILNELHFETKVHIQHV